MFVKRLAQCLVYTGTWTSGSYFYYYVTPKPYHSLLWKGWFLFVGFSYLREYAMQWDREC